VEVLWGSPGSRQKRIKAKVARLRYLELPKNADIDVRSLNSGFAGKEVRS
jgi:hypothetical protein